MHNPTQLFKLIRKATYLPGNSLRDKQTLSLDNTVVIQDYTIWLIFWKCVTTDIKSNTSQTFMSVPKSSKEKINCVYKHTGW